MDAMDTAFEMDTSSLALRPDLPSEFAPALMPAALFAAKPDHLAAPSMHVLSPNQPNLSPPTYLDPPDVIDASPAIHSASAISDFSPYVPTPNFDAGVPAESLPEPASQMPPAHHHPVGLPFALVNSSSSLQSALDPVTPPTRSRSNTLGAYPQPQADLFPPVGHAGPNAARNPLMTGSALLVEIAQTAEFANQACQHSNVRRANLLLQDLRNKISHVSDLIQTFSEVSFHDASPRGSPYEDARQEYFQGNGSGNLGGDGGITFRSSADRKRCHSATDDERPVKSLKSEPQDVPLYSTPAEQPCLPQSPPPSRPHSPTYYHSSTQQITSTYSNGYTGAAEVMLNSVPPPSLPLNRSAWSEGIIPSSRHHVHSLSTSSIPAVDHFARATVPSNMQFPASGAPIGRMTRSGSVNGAYGSPFATQAYAPLQVQPPQPPVQMQPVAVASESWQTTGAPPAKDVSVSAAKRTRSRSFAVAQAVYCDDDDDDEDAGLGDEEDSGSPPNSDQHLNMDYPTSSSSSDVPQEYRSAVDRIFLEFLNRICSNLEAVDTKGDSIHQTLMAKKMQRLDESPDFRPFKFRIAAFTNAFLDELASQGYPEEKIPMKKVRNYLWRQPHIVRYNEDGKKAKSKGNHIWNVEAKKAGDGKWKFRPFFRKLAGTPPSLAYPNMLWTWTPRVWDPRASWVNVPISYSSPWLPPWLKWENNVLSGICPPDAQSCEIRANAKFTLEGQEGHLGQTFNINIAPGSIESTSFSRSSSAHDLTELALANQRAMNRPVALVAEPVTPERVHHVLTTVARRVADETMNVQRSTPPSQQHELGDLVKQGQVISQTLEAYDQAVSDYSASANTQLLARTVQQVVVEAAQSVVAPTVYGRSVSDGEAVRRASVNQMSAGVQGALAHVVKNTAHSSSEMEVMMATRSILAQSRETGMHAGSTGMYPVIL